ncbi:hypothetical protein I3J15_21465 [Streptomyces clavuligerus]|nr:hypothetical protein I3J15_21465 [Streptomyces clavuligerus]
MAKEAALRVLKGFGLERSALSARQVVGSTRIVTADPVVGGLPTHGWSTVLGIGPDGTVLSGSGMLAAPVKGAEEKVVGAATALARLNAASLVIAPSGCATDLPRENGRPAQTAPKAKTVPCGVCATDLPLTGQGEKPGEPEVVCARERPPAAPRTVTVDSVEFGLSLQYPRGTAALVPSWLFRVEPTAAGAAPYTVAQPASESWPGQPAAAPVPAPPVERPVEPPAAGSRSSPPPRPIPRTARRDGR